MIIETARLVIRENIETDLEDLHMLLSDREVMYYLDFMSSNIEESKENLRISIEEQSK